MDPISRIRTFACRVLAVALVAAALSGCGADSGGGVESAVPQRAALQAQAQASATLTATQLMDWAEQQYPTLFPTAGRTQGTLLVYGYRYYPGTGNYVGVSTEAPAGVYLFGPISGMQLIRVGALTDFNCRVLGTDCGTSNTATGTASTSAAYCGYSYSALNATLRLTSTVSITCNGVQRTLVGNGVPDHVTGTFPNANNPNTISAQSYTWSATLTPVQTTASQSVAHVVGYANNSIPFDPATAESYQNQGVWLIEGIQSYLNLGLDASNAHVQPSGAYHYHGIPEGYLTRLGKGAAMTLVGFAMDGFPMYARYGYTTATNANSALKVVKSSWQLKTTADAGRPSTTAVPMGTFTQDYQYISGSGDLDECNGRFGVTPEFPNGIYHYYLTDTWPYIQRCVKGTYTAPAAGPGGPPARRL